ncbi:hypothetical protein BC936DRAFT_138514 [Jimgerdemannia flammicorona]|uniref:Uncharacterized protein n=1 Tax=Jimgerdemannia flammicorona TaxID=994334 RepID=A0A433C978_9FUNG|nr:hypothetical protein BC936DRAFT_138514 [Jimgerdemannia flammicorona]
MKKISRRERRARPRRASGWKSCMKRRGRRERRVRLRRTSALCPQRTS